MCNFHRINSMLICWLFSVEDVPFFLPQNLLVSYLLINCVETLNSYQRKKEIILVEGKLLLNFGPHDSPSKFDAWGGVGSWTSAYIKYCFWLELVPSIEQKSPFIPHDASFCFSIRWVLVPVWFMYNKWSKCPISLRLELLIQTPLGTVHLVYHRNLNWKFI